MPIAEMRRVTVIAHLSQREQILRALQHLGQFEAVNLRETVTPEEWATLFQPETSINSSTGAHSKESDDRLSELKYSIDLVQRFNKEKKSLLDQLAGTRVTLTQAEYEEIVRAPNLGEEIYRKGRVIDERLAELASREDQLRGLSEDLRHWTALDTPLEEIADTHSVHISLGLVENRSTTAFLAKLAEEIPDAIAEVIGQETQTAILLICHKADESAVVLICRQFDFAPVNFPGVIGTPTQAVDRISRQLEELRTQRDTEVAKARELSELRTRLYALFDHYMFLREEEEATRKTGETRDAFVLEGWVPAKEMLQLQNALARVSDEIFVTDRAPLDDEQYPVVLENRPLWSPFEAVTKVAGLPKSGTIDPTPYLAPFFFVFFGVTLGDAGYGIGLVLLSYWLLRRTKAQGMGRQLISLLGVCGVATFLVGALTGSWFGDLFGIKALWFDPTKEPLKMLAVSIVLGVIHIFWGIGIKFADNVKRGKIWDAIFDQALWLILLSGLAMWLVSGSLQSATLLSLGKGLAAVGAVGIVLFAGRSNKNIFARIGSGLYSLYGVSAYMSDVLSYARLLALGLSGSVVAVVFNLLAKMTLSVPVVGVVFMIAILAAGHLFNLVISIISSFVHSSRLQYVEFYGKFYEGGGKRFIPLGVNSKYTQVNRTEEA